MERHRDPITAFIEKLISRGSLDVRDVVESSPGRTAHQLLEMTQAVVETDRSEGSMPDNIENCNIAAMDLSFDFENVAVADLYSSDGRCFCEKQHSVFV